MFGFLVLAIIVLVLIRFRNNTKHQRNRVSPAELNRWQIANKLDYYAEQPAYQEEADTYRAIATALRSQVDPLPQRGPQAHQPIAPQISEQASVPAPMASRVVELQKRDIMNNALVLLYLGAFLVVTSVLVLVAANFENLSGFSKMFVAALLTASFYASGLALYQRPKYRPAGVTFTGIGMVLFPLLGIAYYNFVGTTIEPGLIWLVISILSLALYVYTSQLIKTAAVDYALLLAAISSVEASLFSFDAPLYVLAWAGVVIAGLLPLIRPQAYQDSTGPTRVVSGSLVPIALVFSFLLSQQDPFWQTATTIILAGLYYIEQSLLPRAVSESKQYLTTGLIMGIVGWELLLYDLDYFYGWLNSGSLVAICLGLFAVGRISSDWIQQHRNELLTISALVLLLAPYVSGADYQLKWLTVLLAALLAGGLWYSSIQPRAAGYVWVAALHSLILPAIAFQTSPALDVSEYQKIWFLIGSYALLFLVSFVGRLIRRRDSGTGDFQDLNRASTILNIFVLTSLGLTWFVAQFGDDLQRLIGSLIATIGLIAIAQMYRSYPIAISGLAVSYIAVWQFHDWLHYEAEVPLFFLVWGGLLYGLSWGLTKYQRLRQITMLAGLTGLYLGAWTDLAWQRAIVVFGTSILAALESSLVESKEWRYGAWAGIALGISLILSATGITELVVFTWIWAIYGLFVVLDLEQRGQDSDSILLVTLVVFTVPVGLQTLDGGTEAAWRGALLSFQALLLVGIGLLMNRTLVWRWGAVVLILEVLYQLRSVLYALPKQLLTLGVGVALLLGAIYLLSRQNDD
jgi:hypothetical protein